MTTITRVNFEPVQGASEAFTTEFLEYLTAAHDRFTPNHP